MNFIQYGTRFPDPSTEISTDAHLRCELGWSEVRRGLGLILRGYFVLIAAVLLVVGTIVVLFGMDDADRKRVPWQVKEVGLFLGVAALGLACLYGYGCIVVGHWRCLMNAPERRGAKWLMFACMTCILTGPALNIAAGVGGFKRPPKIQRGLDDVKDTEFTDNAAIMELAGAGTKLLGIVLFLLFLRAVADCFQDRVRVVLVELYLVLVGLLLAGTLFLFLARPKPPAQTLLTLALIVGWPTCFLGYLFLLAVARAGIRQGLGNLRSPLQA